MISHVSVMPRRSMALLVARSNRADALSRMERALTVPRRRPCAPGPGLRLTLPASNRSKENHNEAGPGVVAAFFFYCKAKEMGLIPKIVKGQEI